MRGMRIRTAKVLGQCMYKMAVADWPLSSGSKIKMKYKDLEEFLLYMHMLLRRI